MVGSFNIEENATGVCFWRHNEIVFEMLLVSVEDQINAGVNVAVSDLAKRRYILAPPLWVVT